MAYKHDIKAFHALELAKVVVTPAIAQKLIKTAEKHQFKNRTISKAVVARYASEMLKGTWIPETGEPLQLTRVEGGDEFPLNGYHRLNAIIESGMSVPFIVIRNVPLDAFYYYDAGRLRDLKSVMEINGWSSYGPKATTATMLYKEDLSSCPLTNPSASEALSPGRIFDHIQLNYIPQITDIYNKYLPTLGLIQKGPRVDGVSTGGYGSIGVVAYFAMRAQEVDADLLDKVLRFMAAQDVPAPHVNFARLKVYCKKVLLKYKREKDNSAEKGQHKDKTDELIAAWTVAWNYARMGVKIGAPIKGKDPMEDLVLQQLTNPTWERIS